MSAIAAPKRPTASTWPCSSPRDWKPRRSKAEPTKSDRGRSSSNRSRRLAAGETQVFRVHARADRSGNHVFRAEVVCQSLNTKLAAEEATHFYGDEAARRPKPPADPSRHRLPNPSRKSQLRLPNRGRKSRLRLLRPKATRRKRRPRIRSRRFVGLLAGSGREWGNRQPLPCQHDATGSARY